MGQSVIILNEVWRNSRIPHFCFRQCPAVFSCFTPGTTFFQTFKTFHYAAFDSDTTACIKLKHLAPAWGATQDNVWFTAQWRSARCAQVFLLRKPTKKCQVPHVWHPPPPSSGGYLPAWWIAVWRVLCRLSLESGDSPGLFYLNTFLHSLFFHSVKIFN